MLKTLLCELPLSYCIVGANEGSIGDRDLSRAFLTLVTKSYFLTVFLKFLKNLKNLKNMKHLKLRHFALIFSI